MTLCRLVPGIYSWALSRFFVNLGFKKSEGCIFKNE